MADPAVKVKNASDGDWETVSSSDWETVSPSNLNNVASPTIPQVNPSIKGFLQNVYNSGAQALSSTVRAFSSPDQTLEDLRQTISGLAQKVSSHPETTPQELKQKKKAEALIEFYKKRYGSLDNLGQTLYQDPIGAALDASVLLSGVSGLLRGSADVAAVARAAKTAGALEKGADIAKIGASAIDPVQGTLKAMGAGKDLIVKTLGKTSDKVSGGTLNKMLAEAFGASTGKGPASLMKERVVTDEFVNAMRGKIPETQLVEDVNNAFEKARNIRQQTYQRNLSEVQKYSEDIPIEPIQKHMVDMLKDRYKVKWTPDFGALYDKFTKTGYLSPEEMSYLQSSNPKSIGKELFNKAIGQGDGRIPPPNQLDFSSSTIANPQEVSRINKLWNDINDWPQRGAENSTAVGMDNLRQRVRSLFTGKGDYPNSRSNAVVTDVANNIKSEISSRVPSYDKLLKDYESMSNMLDEFHKDLSVGGNIIPSRTIKRLDALMRDNIEYRRNVMNALSEYSDKDLLSQLAGFQMKNWLPGGYRGWIDTLGIFGASLRGHPGYGLASVLTSPRVVGEAFHAGATLGPSIGSRISPLLSAAGSPPISRTGQVMDQVMMGMKPSQEEDNKKLPPPLPSPYSTEVK